MTAITIHTQTTKQSAIEVREISVPEDGGRTFLVIEIDNDITLVIGNATAKALVAEIQKALP